MMLTYESWLLSLVLIEYLLCSQKNDVSVCFQNDLKEGSNEEDDELVDDFAEEEDDSLSLPSGPGGAASNGPQIQLHITSDSQDEDHHQHVHDITGDIALPAAVSTTSEAEAVTSTTTSRAKSIEESRL